jgi:hypothetical protein
MMAPLWGMPESSCDFECRQVDASDIRLVGKYSVYEVWLRKITFSCGHSQYFCDFQRYVWPV